MTKFSDINVAPEVSVSVASPSSLSEVWGQSTGGRPETWPSNRKVPEEESQCSEVGSSLDGRPSKERTYRACVRLQIYFDISSLWFYLVT